MGRNIKDVRDMVVVELSNKLAFIVSFQDMDVEEMIWDERRFYKGKLEVTRKKDYYIISSKSPESVGAWATLVEKYKAMSNWGENASVQFFGAYSNGVPISGMIGAFPMSVVHS